MRNSFPATLALAFALVAALAGPARAAELTAVIGTQGSARDVQLVGALAYVADGVGGLRLFDLTDPGSPAPLGSLPPLAGGSALAVEVIGTRAYVANGDPGVQIVDVSDPALPVELGSFDPAGVTSIVRAQGDVVYAASASGLSVWDVSDPSDPAPVGALPGLDFGSLRIANGHLVATTDLASPPFRVIDVSDPATPVEIASLPDVRGDIAVDGNTVWASADGAFPSGLVGVDLSDPALPSVFARATAVDELGQIAGPAAVRGRMLFAGSLLIASLDDIGTPQPQRLGHVDLPFAAEDVEISDNQAYVTTQNPGPTDEGGISVVEVQSPGSAFVSASVPLGRSFGLDVVKTGTVRRAYVAAEESLAIVDVSIPQSPGVLSTPGLGGRVLDVEANDTIAAALVSRLAAGCELVTVDVTNPQVPVELDRLAFAGSPGTVLLTGDIAWVACAFADTVHVVDVSDPSDVVEIETIVTGEDPRIARDEDFLYVQTSDQVSAYNVATPAAPLFLGSMPIVTGAAPIRVEAVNRRLFVPPFRIFSFQNPVVPTLQNERWVEDAIAVRSLRVVGGKRLYIPMWRPSFAGRLAIYDVVEQGRNEIATLYGTGLVGLPTGIGVDFDSGLVVSALGAAGLQVWDASADVAAHPCIDGLDNDGDGFVDGADFNCEDAYDDSERAACSDGLDNDGDGLTDWGSDPGCETTLAPFENPQCKDGVDNDGDGFVDHPGDDRCESPGDYDELINTPKCGLLGVEPVLALGLAFSAAKRRRSRRAAGR
jgi:hypothetical protein